MRTKSIALATGALVAAGTVFSAAPAFAINRVSCTNYNFLWVNSNQTTCWANAGTKSVALYSVYGLSSGNNAGYLHGYVKSTGAGYTVGFGKYASSGLPTSTINVVHIN